MNKKITSIIIFISLLCLSSSALAVQIENPLAPGGVNCFSQLLTKIASGVGELVASLGVIMIIVAGILYLTSAGSPEKIGVAKKALIYAIAGIAIGLAATVIVQIIKDVMGAGVSSTTC